MTIVADFYRTIITLSEAKLAQFCLGNGAEIKSLEAFERLTQKVYVDVVKLIFSIGLKMLNIVKNVLI